MEVFKNVNKCVSFLDFVTFKLFVSFLKLQIAIRDRTISPVISVAIPCSKCSPSHRVLVLKLSVLCSPHKLQSPDTWIPVYSRLTPILFTYDFLILPERTR